MQICRGKMLPRVPTAHARSSCPGRRLAPCKFVSGADVAHYLQQEVVIEGVLHVSAAQAGTCLERFGDIDTLPAPALPPLEDVLAGPASAGPKHSVGVQAAVAAAGHSSAASMSRAGSAGERLVNEAFCLATPPDNPSETNRPLRQATPSTARPAAAAAASASRSSGGSGEGAGVRLGAVRAQARAASGVLELEELLQLEGAAMTYQYACSRAAAAHALYAREALQASAAVRRERRRALMRLLRKSRTVTAGGLSALQDSPPAQLLASISASISTLASWDEGGSSSGSSRASSSSGYSSSGSDSDWECFLGDASDGEFECASRFDTDSY